MSITNVIRPERFETCRGLARDAFIVTPDTKFNPDGLFKVSLVVDLSEPEAQAFKSKVDAAANEFLMSEVPEKYRRGWGPYLPYEWEVDAETKQQTGRIVFQFKRNAKIKLLKTGEIKDLTVAVYDSRNKPAWPVPYLPDGSLIRLWAELRPIKITASRMAGVRMDFSCVKVLKMAPPWCPFSDEQIKDGWRAN